jgi:hypothetical protein
VTADRTGAPAVDADVGVVDVVGGSLDFVFVDGALDRAGGLDEHAVATTATSAIVVRSRTERVSVMDPSSAVNVRRS